MPQLGLGTEIGRVSGGAYDPDALAYFSRAGIASGTQTPSSYDNAASFNGTNQFLSIPSNSSLTVTGTSFTYAFWANAVNITNTQALIVKATTDGDNREFHIIIEGSRVQFEVYPDSTYANRKEISIASGAVNTWNFYVCRYDSSGGGTMGISINGGAFTSAGSVGAITQTKTNPLTLGCYQNTASGLNYTGQLASIGFWKRALSASEVTQLWNSGAGRTYASLDSGLLTNLISWWALNQNSVTADSAPTGNNLTNNGTPLVTATTLGPIVTTTQNSRQLINNFVKGIKSLGLWNSMVCWPLRASQNAGAGLTARSLGGLGNFDGTLAGGTLPSWTANGLSLAASSQMNASVTTVPQNVTLLFAAAGDGGAQTGFAQYFGLQRADTWSGNQFSLGCEINPPSLISANQRNSIISSNFTLQTPANPFLNSSIFNFVSGSLSQTSPILNYRNLNTGITTTGTVNTTGTNTLNRLQLNGRWDGSLATGTPHTAAFCGYITPASDGQVSAIYSLYRNTLGIGLNLP
jgi:hypothetical protein